MKTTQHTTIGSTISLFFAAICLTACLTGCEAQSGSPGVESGSGADSRRQDEDKREMTYYTAKQGFGRLNLYLAQQGSSPIKNLWHAMPERTAIYSFGKDRLAGVVGGWVFDYEDEAGANHQARITCWGEVRIAPEQKGSIRYSAPIKPNEWILDNTDAHTAALSRNGIANHENFGGWLMSVSVTGRGQRPVWCGGAWRTADGTRVLGVDAQSGEAYQSVGGKGQFEPAGASLVAGREWDGGFDPKSTSALLGRSEHPYWWPLCYQSPERGHYLYNRPALRQKIEAERKLPSRKAASWQATGVASAALGDWTVAAHDLTRAVELEPDNQQARFQRGLVLLTLRDLDRAGVDFKAVGDSEAGSAAKHLEVLSGLRPRDGLSAFMYNLQTDFGFIPLQFQVGPVPLEKD